MPCMCMWYIGIDVVFLYQNSMKFLDYPSPFLHAGTITKKSSTFATCSTSIVVTALVSCLAPFITGVLVSAVVQKSKFGIFNSKCKKFYSVPGEKPRSSASSKSQYQSIRRSLNWRDCSIDTKGDCLLLVYGSHKPALCTVHTGLLRVEHVLYTKGNHFVSLLS